ncbi:MAG: UbiA family prenyltransferase [Halioglobus sp.]
MSESQTQLSDHTPLVVDLDGTLLLTDILHESCLQLLKNRPGLVPALPLHLKHGKAQLKQYVADRTDLSVDTLPYNQELLTWLSEEKSRGRELILCTASNEKFAHEIAEHLQIFDAVMASTASVNLGGSNKSEALAQRFGLGKYDYVGNSRADLPVWKSARNAIVVSSDTQLISAVTANGEVSQRFAPDAADFVQWRGCLRLQQWLKNLLLFAPALAAHRIDEPSTLILLLMAFLAFSLCASATYVMNDLLDLESDRLHPRKCQRALASGQISVSVAIRVAAVLLLVGVSLSALIGPMFLFCLLIYLVLTCLYSFWLKRVALLDCMVLSVLYTLRIVAGAAAVQMGLSFWLLAFSVFLFLSLAFVKRYAEIEVQALAGKEALHGRGYRTSDGPLIQTLGVSAGFVAVLVFSMYLNSDQILLLYATPQIVWGAVIVLVYWISWMWLQAHRGLMHDDPLVFAMKDRASLCSGALFLMVLLLGTVSFSW